MRFAKFSVFAAGLAKQAAQAPPTEDLSGRVFRFGFDQAVFCSVPGPGKYHAKADILTPTGWRCVTLPFEVPERPICHELVFDLSAHRDTMDGGEEVSGVRFPTWIR
jgi:hypothetical protein